MHATSISDVSWLPNGEQVLSLNIPSSLFSPRKASIWGVNYYCVFLTFGCGPPSLNYPWKLEFICKNLPSSLTSLLYTIIFHDKIVNFPCFIPVSDVSELPNAVEGRPESQQTQEQQPTLPTPKHISHLTHQQQQQQAVEDIQALHEGAIAEESSGDDDFVELDDPKDPEDKKAD